MRRAIFATLAVFAIALTTESAEPAKFEVAATMRVVELSGRADFQDLFIACTELSAAPVDRLGEA